MSVAFPVYVAGLSRDRVVGFVSDDAYYYFNVSKHIAAGHGPTADGVTTTTGFHPAYAFLLAAVHRATDPSLDGFVRQAIVLNGLCSLATALFLYLAAKRWRGELAGAATALLWLVNPHSTNLVSTGLESSVYSMTLSLLLWRLVVFIQQVDRGMPTRRYPRHCALLGVWMGLVLLSRTDAVVLVPPIVLIVVAAMRRTSWTRRLIGGVALGMVSLAFLSMWWAYTWTHTESIAQGSAVVKTIWHQRRVQELYGDGSVFLSSALFCAMTWGKYLVKCFVKIPVLKWVLTALPILFGQAKIDRPRKWLLHLFWAYPAVLGLAYALCIDRPRSWYYAPALVMLTLMAGLAVQVTLTSVEPGRGLAWVRKYLPLIAWVVFLESSAIFARNVVYPRSHDQVRAEPLYQWIDRNVEPATRIGSWHSGILQYYTPRNTIINLDGLANNEIIPVLRGELTMNEYWDKRGITVILGRPRFKMGGYLQEWEGKRLEPWREGVRRVVSSPE